MVDTKEQTNIDSLLKEKKENLKNYIAKEKCNLESTLDSENKININEKLKIIKESENRDNNNNPEKEKEKRIQSVIDKLKQKFRTTKFNLLGRGGFGRVYEVIIDNRKYAIKFLDYEELIEKAGKDSKEINKKMINNELYYSIMLNHKNCLKGINKVNFPEEKIVVLFTVYCENSDLYFLKSLFFSRKIFKNVKIITKDNITTFTKEISKIDYDRKININDCLARPTPLFVKFFIQQILNGLKYLNQCGLIHNDLKLKNIFLTRDFILKIGDYGTIKQKREFKDIPNISTKTFQSPEFLFELKDKISLENVTKLDIFSVGCICYNFLFSKNFLELEEIENLKKMIKNKKEISPLNFYLEKYKERIEENEYLNDNKDLKNFLIGMLNPKIEERYDINTALYRDPWLTQFNDFKYYTEIHDNDSIKLLLELQKIQYSEYMKQRLKNNIINELHKDTGKVIDYEIIDYYD